AGRLKEAIPLLEEAHRAAKKYPELGWVVEQLSDAYAKAGEHAKRIKLCEETLAHRKEALSPDHPDTLKIMHHLGVAYWSAKQLNKSIPLFEELLKRREAKLGRAHPDTQESVANLGVNYKDAGRLKEAIPLLEEAHHAAKRHPQLRFVGRQLQDAYE